MKLNLTFLFSAFQLLTFAQITITSSDLPHMGESMIQRNCMLTGESDMEVIGPDQVWVFNTDVLQPTDFMNDNLCLDVDDSPIWYQFLFNNPFDPAHLADFALGIDSLSLFGTINLESVYSYFQNNTDAYSLVGTGVTINDIPLPSQFNPIDTIYRLPVEYGDSDTTYSEWEISIPTLAYYQLTQTRRNLVEGWGQVIIWDQVFPVLKVRTEIDATDSIFIEAVGLGQTIERPMAVEYKWLCPSFNVPALQINTSGGIVTGALTADIFVGVEEFESAEINISPNPCQDVLRVQIPSSELVTAQICDVMGRNVHTSEFTSSTAIDVSKLENGIYYCVIMSGKKIVGSNKFEKN